MDTVTKSDGLENLSPASIAASSGLYVKFQGVNLQELTLSHVPFQSIWEENGSSSIGGICDRSRECFWLRKLNLLKHESWCVLDYMT